MSSGFVHLTTFIALGGGVVFGSWVANKFRNLDWRWNVFFFALALLIGWFIHVILYDNLWFFFDRMWEIIAEDWWDK